MTALVVVEAAAILLLGLLVVGLLRSHAEILRQLHQLGAGRDETVDPAARPPTDGPAAPSMLRALAPDVGGLTPAGEAVAVGVGGAPHDTVVAFLSSGCSTCAAFWHAFQAGRPDLGLPPGTRVVIVTKGAEAESEAEVAAMAPHGLPVVMSSQAWLDYGVPGAPYFVYVEAASGRVVGEGTGGTWEQVVGLLTRARADRRAAAGRDGGQEPANGESRVDRDLLAAGITPGHPSLYPGAPPEQHDQAAE